MARARNLALIVTLLVLLCTGLASAADVIYAFGDDGIYSLNATNGAAINVYTGTPFTNTAASVQAGAARPSDGLVFFLLGTGGNQQVYTWNPATPATVPTLLGTTGVATLMPRLAFDISGNLVGATGLANPQMYTISQTTGVATLLGSTVTGVAAGGGDLALSPTGTLYMAVANELYSVTESGGAATNIGAVGSANNITGLTFGPGGVLYGVDSSNPSNVYTINTGTGAGTLIGTASRINPGNMGDLGSVLAPDIHLTKTDDSVANPWTVGQSGNYYLTPDNISGSASTSGTITVTDTMPTGITPVSTTGSGADWSCNIVSATVTCTSTTVLAPGGTGTTIDIQVNIGTAAEPSVSNTATVSGGGSPPYNASDGVGVDATTVSAATGSTGTLFIGPVDAGEATYLGADLTGSYDGQVAANNNYDFTAMEIPFSSGTILTNTSTVLGSPTGNAVSAASVTMNVPNKFYFHNTTGSQRKINFYGTAPNVPGGWTIQICPDNGSGTAPNCTLTTQGSCTAWVEGAAGQTSTSSCKVAKNVTASPIIWAIYTTPSSGLVAFTRYDANINAQQGTGGTANNNITYNELYAGYIPLTKTQFVVKTGCPAGESPPFATGVCPSGIIQYQIDYRNIMVGAGLGTEGALASAFVMPQAGTFTITENGSLSPSTWGTSTNGLMGTTPPLVGGATAPGAGPTQTNCGLGGSCGDTITGSTFTGNALGSTLFTDTPGGASFALYPPNFVGQTSQGTVIFAVTVK